MLIALVRAAEQPSLPNTSLHPPSHDDCERTLTRLRKRVCSLKAENEELKTKLKEHELTIEMVSSKNKRLKTMIKTISEVINMDEDPNDTKDEVAKTIISQMYPIDSASSKCSCECSSKPLSKEHESPFQDVNVLHQEAVNITKKFIDSLSGFPVGCNDWLMNNEDWFKNDVANAQDKLKQLAQLAHKAETLLESDIIASRKMGEYSKCLNNFPDFLNSCEPSDYPRITSACVGLVKGMFETFKTFTSTAIPYRALGRFSTFLTSNVSCLNLHADYKVTDLYKMRMQDLILRIDELVLKDRNG